MAFSGKIIRYRTGDKIDTCGLYNVTTDILENDISIPVSIDNTTMYLIGVHPGNEALYTLSSLTYDHNDITYTIAQSKYQCKTVECFYSGNKYESLGDAHDAMYNLFISNIESSGHTDYISVSKITTGLQVEFNNVKDSFVKSYRLVGSGGNGGAGGTRYVVTSSCYSTTYYGGGGGGGEAGSKYERSTPTRANIVKCEYTSTLGQVRLRAFLDSSSVINVTATYGDNGSNASGKSYGAGGSGRTNQTNGSNGTSGTTSKTGIGGAGGVISGYRCGYGGKGGNGNKKTTINSGSKGGPWLLKICLAYYI